MTRDLQEVRVSHIDIWGAYSRQKQWEEQRPEIGAGRTNWRESTMGNVVSRETTKWTVMEVGLKHGGWDSGGP